MDILDCHPVAADMRSEVLDALNRRPRHLPSKYFYDARGAQLFEAICELPEYYPTRTEIGILEQALPQISTELGPGRWVVEPGSGSGIKTRMLLEALEQPRAYVPIDISKRQLSTYGEQLLQDYPTLLVRPICADFTQDLKLPAEMSAPVIWFPGSTIGNFSPREAGAFLHRLRRWGEGRAELLIGVDLRKDRTTLEAAYNDAQGVTAEFNRNLLLHINRALGADFQPESFQHAARWNEKIGAIQMFLLSQRSQHCRIDGHGIDLAEGEEICTEYSYKYAPQQFSAMASDAGWREHALYTDCKGWFGLFHLR